MNTIYKGFAKNDANIFLPTTNSTSQKNSTKSRPTLVMRWIFALLMLAGANVSGQTTLINPATDGGFESGFGTFTVVNSATGNRWFTGTAAGASAGSNAAFIGSSATTYTDGVSQTVTVANSFYKDIIFPAGQTLITLTFDYKQPTLDGTFDLLRVFLVPTTTTITAGTALTTGQISSDAQGQGGQATFAGRTIIIAGANAGTTQRLVFQWKNDGATPYGSGAIDKISLVSATPAPISGTYTIDNTVATGGTNFNSFTSAINYVNTNGINGPLTFNVTSGQTFTEVLPALSFTGTAANPIIFQKNGAAANPVIVSTGSTGTEAAVLINGSDYLTFDGINITASGTALEYGYYMQNATATNGAQNNTIKNCTITLNRTNTLSVGIIQLSGTTPTSAAGANSNNKYYNLTVKNAGAGILLQGATAFPDLNTEVGTTSCAIRNTIGDPATADDILNSGSAGSSNYGIKATNQGAVKIFNNDISNVTTNVNQSTIDGIFIDNSAATVALGTSDVFNNKITTISSSSTGANANNVVRGIRANGNLLAGTITRIYNNFISNLQTGNTNATLTIRRIIGISAQPAGGAGSAASIYCEFNSVRIAATNLAVSNSCFEIGISSGVVYRVRNNIFANFTGAQSGGAKHYTWVTTSATAIGGTGSVSNYNDLYVTGTNGFVGLGNATDYATLANWQTATGQDANSKSIDPLFTSATDLHLGAVGLDGVADPAYATNTPWATSDIDCATRAAATDIGADEASFAGCTGANGGTASGSATFCASGTPTITASGFSTGTNTAYQWEYSNDNFVTDVHDFVGQINPAALTTGVVTTTTYYRLRVTCTTVPVTAYSNVVTVTINANPVVSVTPTTGSVCSPGGTGVALTASGAATYAWSPAAGLSATTGATVTATPTVTTTYTVTGTAANGCTGTATATITVLASPTGVTATATPATICTGATSQLSTTFTQGTANTYAFTGGTTTYTAITGTTLGAAAIGDDAGIGNLPIGFTFGYNANSFTVFGARSNGLIELGQTTATLSGFSANALASTANCIAPLWDDNNTTGGSIIYATTGVTPNRILTVQWTGMHVGNSGDAAQPTINMQVKLYEGSNRIEFIYGSTSAAFITTTASIGISGAVGNYVSVTPLSPASTSTKSTTTENTTISSAANFPSGTIYTFAPNAYTYSWSPAGDVVSPTSASTLTNPLSATETFTVTVSNGGCSVTASTTVTVASGAAITTNPSNVTVCAGATATFSVVATGPGLTYQWRKNGIDIPVGSNASAGTATLILPATTAADAGTYDVVVTSTCGSPVTSTGATLTVNPVPTASASSNSPVCTGSSLNLTGTTNIGTTFAWTGPNGFTSTVQNPVISPVTTAAAGTYTFTATLNGCSSVPATTTVVVNQSPVTPTVTPASATTICLGASQALTASSTAVPVNLLTQNFNSGLGSWTVVNGTGHTAGTEWLIKTPPYTYSTSIVNSNGADGSNFILANSDLSGGTANLTLTRLVSPVFSTTGITGVTIGFSHFLRALSEAFVGVEYTINGGTTWTAITGGTFTASTTSASSTTPPFSNVSLTLNAAALNQAAVQIRFRYDASFDYYWGVDNIAINGLGSPNYTWSANPAAGAGLPATAATPLSTNSSITATPTVAGSYTYSAVAINSANGCTSAAGTTGVVTVNPNYTITASAGANGTISPAGVTTVSCNGTGGQTYTITPDAGYAVADVLVDGVSVGAVTTYSFTNVTADHTISASFVINNFTITSTAGANGTISPLGATSVTAGANQTYTITPNACYAIADVLVDGVSNAAAIASGTFTFTNVTANHTISATFVQTTYTITATSGANGTVTPAGASTVNCGDDATYTITPAACYAIADVLVDGVSNAAAIATGTFTFTNVTANHTISATFVQTTYTITATSGANGSVTPAGASTVNCGDNATYTITPAACYAIADVLVDGVSNAGAIATGTFTFTNVTANHTISATFVLTTYTITATAGANGTVTPAGASTVNCGDDATYTITPAACYAIADVLVDGVSNAAAIASGTFTFTNVTANHTISATFVQTTYTITATSGANGTVTPAGASTVNCGDDATYTITPAACYAIADVLVDGVSNAGAIASGTFTFTNVTANHTISATFVQTTYTITATSGANGTVTPAGASTVNCGDDATYTITPAACYAIADVLVDGVSNAGAIATGTFTFTNVTANHTISAIFVQTTYTITATSGANGTVTPAGASTVNCGDDATYTITPAACYAIADVLVDGVSNAGAIASGTFTFTNVTANHTISATFVQTTYTITATSGANGTVTPAGASTVNCGDDATYTITPAACYAIADVLVDGVSNAGAIATGTFTFTNVTANHTISAIFVQTTYTITATSGANGTVTPAGASTVNCGDDATYTITPAACYAIADVLVDGVSNAGAIATGTFTFTNVTANHTISATFVQTTYTITATSGANGTVTPAGASTVNCGDDATYTITPAACYQIADVLVDGVSNAAAIASGTFTFTNVTANHTISATFVLTTYTITATAGVNGSISFPGASTVGCGANATYNITPNACYAIADVLVDGVSVGAVPQYTFINVTANHTISATFVQTTYTITATSGANGTVTPTGASTVNCGANATYTITPNAGFAIADVLVDGVSVGALGTYTFTNVTANHTISASFVANITYTITSSAGANGTIAPNGVTTLSPGANQTYSITAAACYHVSDVLVDGVSVGAVTTYTFTNVQANHTISASFVADAPLTAPVITGPVNSCQYIGTGEGVTYTFNSPGATGYSYVLPPNTMLQSSTANSITITFQNGFAAQGNRQIRVTALSPCGNSPVGIFYLAAQAPVTPSQIVGNTNVCAIIGTANTYTYTIPSVPGASSYNWTAQSGTTTISHPNGLGVNDTTITISFTNGFTTSNLTVAAVNGCSSSTARSLTIQRINPTVPALISGPTNVCENILPAGTPATYRIVKVAGATSYNWTVTPNTAVVTHPNGSGVLDTVITVTFQAGFTSGTVTVSASNGCGTSGVRSLSLVKLTPGSPSAFDVIQLTQCPNRSYSYTLPSLPANTTSLQWTVPTSQGAVITSQTATSITVSYPATAVNGTVTVQAFNNCGSSPVRSKQINLAICGTEQPRLAANGTKTAVAESFSVNVFPNPSVADFKLQVLTAGREKVNVRILDMQARVYKQFTVMPYQTTTIGSELKAGAYLLEVTQGSTVKTTKLLKF